MKAISKFFSDNKFILSLIIIYTVIICFISYHHELWRDEVRALSIVIESESINELFDNLSNEGHPYLWYLILYFGYALTQNLDIIKIIHLIIAICSVFIILKSAPLSKFNLVLMIFGYFIIYEYAVINRNYNLSMLLIFMFCALYDKRYQKIIYLGFILAILANSNAHSLVLVLVLFTLLMHDFIKNKHSLNKIYYRKFLVSCLVVFCGIVLSIIQIIPDKSTIATQIYTMGTNQIFKNITKALLIPGESFQTLFGIKGIIIPTILIWIFALSFFKKHNAFYIFILGTFSLSLFFKLVYPAAGPRHEGFLFLVIISAYWIENSSNKIFTIRNEVVDKISSFFFKNKEFILSIFLIIQIFNSYDAVKDDISKDYSSAKVLGYLLKNNSTFKNAIIVSEPDYLIESLPFYADNSIYFIRESKFGLKVNFTKKSKSIVSLLELLDKGVQLRNLHIKNIIFVIGYTLQEKGPFILNAGFSRKFIYSKEQLDLFFNRTKKIAGFHDAITDENYDIFLLKH